MLLDVQGHRYNIAIAKTLSGGKKKRMLLQYSVTWVVCQCREVWLAHRFRLVAGCWSSSLSSSSSILLPLVLSYDGDSRATAVAAT
jgi:hypothetical protein